jgi:hypothetical protein
LGKSPGGGHRFCGFLPVPSCAAAIAHEIAVISTVEKTFEPFSDDLVPRALEFTSTPSNPQSRRTTMSRKIILSLAAATLAVATLSSQADARGFGGGGGFGGGRGFGGGGHMAMARFTGHGGRTLTPIFPGHGHPVMPGPFPHSHPSHWVFHHHDHGHWVFRFGRWIAIDDVVDETPAPAVVAAPGPCTCLTKTYTPSGLVVFADICTKESASAAVDGSADATQVPTTPVAANAVPMSVVPTAPNYAGRTYEDYLAANPQSAQPQAANPPPQATQKN